MTESLMIIQPLLSRYRMEVYGELSRRYCVRVLYSPVDQGQGFGSETANFQQDMDLIEVRRSVWPGGRLFYQHGVIGQVRRMRPDRILTFADPHYISYWILLIYCIFTRRKVYSHTQGPYNKPHNAVYRLLYSLMSVLSTRVILYTPYSLKKIVRLGVSIRKFRVAANSLVNRFPIIPQQKDFTARGVLFVGRLREGADLELLCDAAIALQKQHPDLVCHVVGSGELETHYRNQYAAYSCIRFYGMVYDQQEVARISLRCGIGCYPGDAGLSVVHYMSLSLPCLVHGDIPRHMGPEPSYVTDGGNGRLFRRMDGADLQRVLGEMLENGLLESYARAAYATYESLTDPSYAERLAAIFEEN